MRVLVFGGTHGNEWTGVIAVTRFTEYFKNKFPDLELEFILANPEAHKLNQRFKDEDLNRAFQFLSEERVHSYENQRAREIKKIIEKSDCFVIDLHTTTSNMGSTVIISQYNQFNFSLAAHLTKELPDCRVIGSPDPQKKYLGSLSNHGMMIEVGPVPNGVIGPHALTRTIDILEAILGKLAESSVASSGKLEIFEEIQNIYYPREGNGQLSAYIHEEFQGKDFQAIKGKYKPFKTFHGDDLILSTDEELFPIFINEAAYYPQHLAYTLCRKIMMEF